MKEAERATGTSLQSLLTDFEMLSGNCDMGLFQRALGVEPLGLLRFAGAEQGVAIKGLDTRFADIGQHLLATVSAENEWMISDRFGLQFHSGHFADAIDECGVIAAERKKIGFLKRKFLEDIEEGQKIFVFADRFGLPVEGAMALHLALCRHGNHRLLWVRHGRPWHRGMVEEVLPGLLLGHFEPNAPPMIAHISGLSWLSVMVNAHLLATQIGTEER